MVSLPNKVAECPTPKIFELFPELLNIELERNYSIFQPGKTTNGELEQFFLLEKTLLPIQNMFYLNQNPEILSGSARKGHLKM